MQIINDETDDDGRYCAWCNVMSNVALEVRQGDMGR